VPGRSKVEDELWADVDAGPIDRLNGHLAELVADELAVGVVEQAIAVVSDAARGTRESSGEQFRDPVGFPGGYLEVGDIGVLARTVAVVDVPTQIQLCRAECELNLVGGY